MQVSISNLKIDFPRQNMAKYLPSFYDSNHKNNSFLKRFLFLIMCICVSVPWVYAHEHKGKSRLSDPPGAGVIGEMLQMDVRNKTQVLCQTSSRS